MSVRVCVCVCEEGEGERVCVSVAHEMHATVGHRTFCNQF